MVGQVFISYRRNDQPGSAGRLYDRLDAKFQGQVFMDVQDIPAGHNFTEVIDDRVELCDVVLVMIGDRWLSAIDEASGKRRLDQETDFVRREVAAALRIPDRVIPVLLDNTKELCSDSLPAELQLLSKLQALRLEHSRFEADAEKIAEAVDKAFKKTKLWDQRRFLAAANSGKGPQVARNYGCLIDSFDKNRFSIKWGSGIRDGSFLVVPNSRERTVFSGSTNGTAYLYMTALQRLGILTGEDERKAAISKLNRVDGFSVEVGRGLKDYVGFPVASIRDMDSFQVLLQDVLSGNLT